MHWNAIIVAPHVNYILDPHTRVHNPHHVISSFVAAVQNGWVRVGFWQETMIDKAKSAETSKE